ncbi:MAG TPA: hypothetical protein VJS66_08120 [Burkholderiales bacterium]|nr:hypothetical protein [Burkholderiales bacterium]
MPLINGVCIPNICYEVVFGFANAALMQYTTRAGVLIDTRNVTNNFPDLFKQGKDKLSQNKKLECDGCVCFNVRPPAGGPATSFLVESRTDTDANGVVTLFEYRLEGATFTFRSFGFCFPPGTKVKVIKGGKAQWVPVEEAHDLPPAPSSSGGKKKKGKKKRRKTKTRKTAPRKKGRKR